MDAQVRDVLAELETFGSENDEQQNDRSKKMLNLEPDAAQFMSILVRSHRAKRILEIGTSNGYSTIWLAWSAQFTGGQIISLDRDADKHEMADANLKRAGLREFVELRQGDATELVAALEGTVDFVFFDADRWTAPEQLRLLLPKLDPGALVIADNVHSHPDQIAGYLQAIEDAFVFDHMVIAVGKGLSIAYKTS